MGKNGLLVATFAFLLSVSALAQTTGHCSASMDLAKIAPEWANPYGKLAGKFPPNACCMQACSPRLTVWASADDEPTSLGETVEQHTKAFLADTAQGERRRAEFIERGRRQQPNCRDTDVAAAPPRTIDGLPFYGLTTVQRCHLRPMFPVVRFFMYEAVGGGCHFAVTFGSLSADEISGANRVQIDRALGTLSFSFAKQPGGHER